jgi:tetratricopeptide (TPR) repeat protein
VTVFRPGGNRPVEWLFLDTDCPGGELSHWLALALPHCAWNSHIVIVGPDRGGRLLGTVVEHLDREPLALVHVHQLADGGLDGSALIDGLLEAASGFQAEAYRERTGARLVPLPILEVAAGADPRPALHRAGELAALLAKPSLLVWDEPGEEFATAASETGTRLYVGSTMRNASAMEVLTAAHVLDGALDRVEGGGPLLEPCAPHLTVVGGRTFGCAQQWRLAWPGTACADRRAPEWRPDPSLCHGCIADTVAGSGPELAANLCRHEGRELALRVSASLARSGYHDPAAMVAETAAELSTTAPSHADALIQIALLRLAGGRLDEAERALLEAGEFGAPAGLVAYHRARVQVAWRDDIEALDRFAEALERRTDAASPEEIHLEMALSHIRIEEWGDARAHLEMAGEATAAIEFNLGVCDVNESAPEPALDHFDRALELGPSPEDLGRVWFFRGFCLKELERFGEAADDLRRSTALEAPEPAHHNLLGFCLFKLGRHAEAVECFEQAVDLDPSSAIDWANIGVNLERLGEKDRARRMYRKALGMDGSIDFAKEGLGRLGG